MIRKFSNARLTATGAKVITATLFCVPLMTGLAFGNSDKTRSIFDEAKNANARFDNARLLDIVTTSPHVLLAKDQFDRSLIDFAFSHFNDDAVSQTNFEFIQFLLNNNFFAQSVEKDRLFFLALEALRGADKQIGRIDLSEDMRVHTSREPFLALLSQTISLRDQNSPLSSEDSLNAVLEICDKSTFADGQQSFFSKDLVAAISAAISPLHFQFVQVYTRTGTIAGTCATALLNTEQ